MQSYSNSKNENRNRSLLWIDARGASNNTNGCIKTPYLKCVFSKSLMPGKRDRERERERERKIEWAKRQKNIRYHY